MARSLFTHLAPFLLLVASSLGFGSLFIDAYAQCHCGDAYLTQSGRFLIGGINPSPSGDDAYLYFGAGQYPHILGTYGAVLELAGNNVMPETSRGRAQLFSGNNPEGRIGFNITHPAGSLIVQSAGYTTLVYKPALGTIEFVGVGTLSAHDSALFWNDVKLTP